MERKKEAFRKEKKKRLFLLLVLREWKSFRKSYPSVRAEGGQTKQLPMRKPRKSAVHSKEGNLSNSREKVRPDLRPLRKEKTGKKSKSSTETKQRRSETPIKELRRRLSTNDAEDF